MNRESQEQPAETLATHLQELRKRLLWSLLFIVIAFVFSWNYSSEIFDLIRKPIEPYLASNSGGLVFTGVMDKFMAHLKVSLLAALVLSCPFWIYQLWKFISPGLYKNEKKYAISFILFGSVLFISGVVFVYYIVFPTCFEFLMTFGGTKDQPMITISDYVSFFMTMTLLFGVVFELPLVLVVLGMMGVIDATFLKQKRRYAIVLLALVAAVATPTPDMFSMLAMLVPLVGLYELSIFLVSWTQKKITSEL